MTDKPIRITVYILDKPFEMICPKEGRTALEESVRMLNRKMLTIRSSGTSISHERIAIQAAVNIAHELLQLQQNSSSPYIPVQNDIEKMIDKLDSQIVLIEQDNNFAS